MLWLKPKKKPQPQQQQLIIQTNESYLDIGVTCFHHFFTLFLHFNFRLQQVMMIKETARDLIVAWGQWVNIMWDVRRHNKTSSKKFKLRKEAAKKIQMNKPTNEYDHDDHDDHRMWVMTITCVLCTLIISILYFLYFSSLLSATVVVTFSLCSISMMYLWGITRARLHFIQDSILTTQWTYRSSMHSEHIYIYIYIWEPHNGMKYQQHLHR